MASIPAMQPRELFGGAIRMALPQTYLDASDVRQIPDNQEVFLSRTSNTSVIVEVLAHVHDEGGEHDLAAAARFHWGALAHDNNAVSTNVLTAPEPTPAPGPIQVTSPEQLASLPTPSPLFFTGTQAIHKFPDPLTGQPRPGHENDEPDQVWIGLAMWRVNLAFANARREADVVCSVNVPAEAGEEERASVEQWWRQAVAGMKIVDYDLFENA